MSGKSMIIDPFGKIMSQASPSEEQLLTVEIDRAQGDRCAQKVPALSRPPAGHLHCHYQARLSQCSRKIAVHSE